MGVWESVMRSPAESGAETKDARGIISL